MKKDYSCVTWSSIQLYEYQKLYQNVKCIIIGRYGMCSGYQAMHSDGINTRYV